MKQPVNPKNTSHEKSARVDVVYAGNAVYAVFQKGENYEKENTCIVSDMYWLQACLPDAETKTAKTTIR